ncbi:right-handed parallel beta-helix repeat-containing protein [Candidatus Woesearchaeota archaeon]|nr:right-handed parallel beta-helix repeat-containing protein [Candidatus Woesearchaeota archaeon]
MKKRGRSSFELRSLVIPLLALIAFTILFFLAGKYFFPEFFSTGFFVYSVQPPGEFKSSETITTCPYTITTSGEYNLTSDLSCGVGNGITIDADDVVLDCLGHKITGLDNNSGIYAYKQNNITVKNCVVEHFKRGIFFINVTDFNIESSTFANNTQRGINFYLGVKNGIILNSKAINNSYYGVRISKLCDNLTFDNITVIGPHSRGFWINNSANITIKNSDFIDNRKHIFIESHTKDVFIDDCEFNQGDYGIHFAGGQIEKIYVKNSQFHTTYEKGINVKKGLKNSCINNSLFQNSWINFKNSDNILIFNNTLNGSGITIDSSKNITLRNNTIQNAFLEAIKIESTDTQTQSINIVNNSIVNVYGTINEFGKGIYVKDANLTTITNNYFNNMSTAIYLDSSSDNQIKSNSITASRYGIYGINISSDVFENNEINAEKSCININGGISNNIKNNVLQNAFSCILLKTSIHDVINATNTTNCYYGALIHESEDVLVDRALFEDGVFGILLMNSTHVQITEATINNNDKNGVAFELKSFNNSLWYSNITNNQGHGVRLNFFTHHNTISNNTITNNAGYGIYMDFYATNNTIQYNDLSGNTQGTYYEGDFCTGNTFTGNTP